MIRPLFSLLLSSAVGLGGLVANRSLLLLNSHHFPSGEGGPLADSDTAHWVLLSGLLMFGDDNLNEDAQFFGVSRLKKESDEKITLDNAGKVRDNADALRRKCHGFLNRRKLDLKSPSLDGNDKTKISNWCLASSPHIPKQLPQFAGFLEWEYRSDKRLFLAAPTTTTTTDNGTLSGYFLANLIPHLSELMETKITDEETDQEKKFFWNFLFLHSVDFYGCLSSEKLKENKGYYRIKYVPTPTTPPTASTQNEPFCQSMRGGIQWVTHEKKPALTHYKIAKDSNAIKTFIEGMKSSSVSAGVPA